MSEKREAMFYQKLKNGNVHCFLCPHNCKIPKEGRGICGVRKNVDGKLFSLNYGELTSIGVDPIERSRCNDFTQEPRFSLWALWAAISNALSARTTGSRR